MQVTYNGFTGELWDLKKSNTSDTYGMTIYDHKNETAHSFFCVNLKDVKFIGVEVTLK